MPTYDSKIRYDVDHWAKVNSVLMNIVCETQDISTKKMMAVHGIGIIAASNHTVQEQVLSGDLIEIGKLHGLYEDLYLVSAERKFQNTIAQKIFQNFSV